MQTLIERIHKTTQRNNNTSTKYPIIYALLIIAQSTKTDGYNAYNCNRERNNSTRPIKGSYWYL